uniref:Uncharacterized protein n=1 Tax=Oryza sativa subsp. japonica TaxID=39947 RepID=Q6ERH4_ORYSJ|nr:hypothetical protein [Oryza sativa Japonica Group]
MEVHGAVSALGREQGGRSRPRATWRRWTSEASEDVALASDPPSPVGEETVREDRSHVVVIAAEEAVAAA